MEFFVTYVENIVMVIYISELFLKSNKWRVKISIKRGFQLDHIQNKVPLSVDRIWKYWYF